MDLFYLPNISQPIIHLPEEESKHCIRVLRMKTGDAFLVTDGKGNSATATITNNHPKKCEIQLSKQQFSQAPSPTLHMAVAPTKNNERLEWFLEKAVEMGISEFTPLECENSERTKINYERLQRVAIAAMKQSQKMWLPVIHQISTLPAFIKQNHQAQKFIAHCNPSFERSSIKQALQPGEPVVIMIGPEGDFTSIEIEDSLKNTCLSISLGTSRLRTETAALAACNCFHILNNW